MSASHAHDETTAVRFGRYEVIQTLGSGGMASVYLAMVKQDGECKLLALKQSHGTCSPKAWSEAIREAKCGESIRHPNVVGVVEVGAGAQGPYIVMEYVEGGSLLSLLTEGATRGSARRLPVAIACRVVIDALRGLHAAHEATDETGTRLGLIHRDVSPQNVLVSTDGVAKLADFGIAKLVQMSNTGPGLLRGKPGYVAPEQALGQQLDPRTDVFSMGIVLWECLTGRRLFRGTDQHETLMRVVRRVPARVDRIFNDIPASIADVCRAALEKDKRARPQSAKDFADLLEQAARGAKALATHEQVGSYVKQILAGPLSRRRQLLGEWLSHTGVTLRGDLSAAWLQPSREADHRHLPTASPDLQAGRLSSSPAGQMASALPTSSSRNAIAPPPESTSNPLATTLALQPAPAAFSQARRALAAPAPSTPLPPPLDHQAPLRAPEPSGVRLKSTAAAPTLASPPTRRAGRAAKRLAAICGLVAVWALGFACARVKPSQVQPVLSRASSTITNWVSAAR